MKLTLEVIGLILILIGVFLITGFEGGITGYSVSLGNYNLKDTQLVGWSFSIIGGIINFARLVKGLLDRFYR